MEQSKNKLFDCPKQEYGNCDCKRKCSMGYNLLQPPKED